NMAHRLMAGMLQLLHPLRQTCLVDIDQHHSRALAGEDLAGRKADRPGGAGDQHAPAFVALHFFSPLRNGSVSRNRMSPGDSSFSAARACSGVSVALIGMVP